MKIVPIYRWIGGPVYGPAARFAHVGFAKVDDWWYDRITAMGRWMQVRTSTAGRFYARLAGRKPGTKEIRMHQVIAWDWVDHKNGDGLDNQEKNLRKATRSDQGANSQKLSHNTSGEPCVSYVKQLGKWRVRVCRLRQPVFYRVYADFDEAVQVARAKRKELHGEFVRNE